MDNTVEYTENDKFKKRYNLVTKCFLTFQFITYKIGEKH